ncbi:unnamed protein product, partial [Ostreobium quekettii]
QVQRPPPAGPLRKPPLIRGSRPAAAILRGRSQLLDRSGLDWTGLYWKGVMVWRWSLGGVPRWMHRAAASCGLQFADPDLEREYENELSAWLLGFDRVSLLVRMAVVFTFTSRLYFSGELVGAPALAQLGFILTLAAEGCHKNGMAASARAPRRCRSLALDRVVSGGLVAAAAVILTPISFSGLEMDATSVGSVAFFRTVDSGAFTILSIYPYVPLPLKHQLPLIASIAGWHLLVGQDCSREVADPGVVIGLWRGLSEACRRLLSAVLMREVDRRPAPEALGACLHMGFMFLFCSLLASAFTCAVFEHWSRSRFLAARPRTGEKWTRVWGGARLHYLLCLVVFVALVWEATSPAEEAVLSGGCPREPGVCEGGCCQAWDAEGGAMSGSPAHLDARSPR